MPLTDRHPLNWLLQQFRLKPGKPAFVAGLRTLTIVSGSIGVGMITGHASNSAIATMAAWSVGMTNVGGTYRQQATAMIAATIGVTTAFFTASLVSSNLWLAIPTTFILMAIAGLAGLYGSATASVGLVSSIMFVVSLAKFASLPFSAVLMQCVLCLAGGTWAMVVSLGLWVVRPYAPAMQAVAKCYLSLSKLVKLIGQRNLKPLERTEWVQQFSQAQDTVIQDLTSARSVWASVWTRQKAANERGNQLLVLIEDANQIVNSVVALVELLAIADRHPLCDRLHRENQQVLEQLAVALQKLSRAIAQGRKSVYLGELDWAIEALEHNWQILRSQVLQNNDLTADDYADLFNIKKTVSSFSRLVKQIHADADIVTDLNQAQHHIAQRNILPPTRTSSSIISTLRDNLSFRSLMFRHALRLATIVTLAELTVSLLQIPRGYWITLTALIALKPNFGGTSQTIVQRVIGTIIGGIIGSILVVLIESPMVSAVCILLLLFIAMSVRPLSYSVFTTLLTPALILLFNIISAGGWEIGVLRIVDTIAGGMLALLGSYLLFPRWERQQLPVQLEKTLRANLAYFQAVANAYDGEDAPTDSVSKSHCQAALENANAAAAAQRLFSEPRHVQGEVESVMTLMLYMRGFFSSVATLADHLHDSRGEYHTDFQRLADTIVRVLENLADALQQGIPPQPLPALDSDLEAFHNQIEGLHTARISEIATNPNTVTPTLQAIREQTPVYTQMERIVDKVTVMHCVLAKLCSQIDRLQE